MARQAFGVQLVGKLLDVAELRGEIQASLQATNNKVERLLALQGKVERNSQVIARLKAVSSLVAAGIALLATATKDWLFTRK